MLVRLCGSKMVTDIPSLHTCSPTCSDVHLPKYDHIMMSLLCAGPEHLWRDLCVAPHGGDQAEIPGTDTGAADMSRLRCHVAWVHIAHPCPVTRVAVSR